MSTEQPPSQSTPILPGDATERLIRMLDSVRLEKPDIEPRPSSSGAKKCPQCRSSEPWGAASWCPNCGYYPKLGRTVSPSELESHTESSPPVSYKWAAWLVLGGLTAIALSVASTWIIPDPVVRADYGRLQFIFGLVMIIIGQVMAYFACTRETDDLSLSALFFEPVRLWLAVVKNLPQYRRTLYVGSWGALCMTLAVFVTGMDFDGMFAHLKTKKSKKSPLQTLVKAVTSFQGNSAATSDEDVADDDEQSLLASAGGGTSAPASGDLETAINDLAGMAAEDLMNSNGPNESTGIQSTGDLDSLEADVEKELADITDTPDITSDSLILEKKVAPLAPSGKPRKDESQLVVFGYLTNAAGEIRSILLADISTPRPRYAGKLSLDELTSEESAQVQTLLESIRSRRAALPLPFHARWVHPLLIARVAHVGRTMEGHLKDGYLMGIDDSHLRKHAPPAQASLPPVK